MEFPEISEEDGIQESETVEIAEGDPYPQADFSYDENAVVYTKYGVALTISDEAIEDTSLDVVMDGQMELLTSESRRMDSIAYSVLAGAAVDSGKGNGDDDLSLDELIDGRAYHRTDEGGNYDPDLAFVEPLGAGSILKELSDRNTAEGDEATRTGKIGDIAGMEILESGTGALAPHDSILVDSDQFGWESVKHEKDVESERKTLSDETVYSVSDRLGWVATDADAAVHVDG